MSRLPVWLVAVPVLASALSTGPAAWAEPPPTLEDGRFRLERCLGLILLFDRIVQSRFDARLLPVESWELEEARRWRDEAQADCAAGEVWFGVQFIEDALRQIGVVPPLAEHDEVPD